ncbi:phage N-6-adenine-methyltransferase [Dokdonia sp.]|uniref:phage N-6-adenine-methyltransferase n=1 Tax=Dokdonia sp. TaxID=2024995 RepID=UPI003267CC99
MHKVLFSSNHTTWETPQWLFDKLEEEFNFTLDPCCVKETAKCKKYYTPEDDGLIQDWSGETVFVNPPYGRDIVHWVRKANQEAQKGTTIVMLLPARTSTRWFHDWIYNDADEIRFVKGRLCFLLNGEHKGSAPFPSCVVVFNGNNHTKKQTT